MKRIAAAVLVLWGGLARAQENPAPGDADFFEKKIRPVLSERCYSCHSAKALRSGSSS